MEVVAVVLQRMRRIEGSAVSWLKGKRRRHVGRGFVQKGRQVCVSFADCLLTLSPPPAPNSPHPPPVAFTLMAHRPDNPEFLQAVRTSYCTQAFFFQLTRGEPSFRRKDVNQIG